MPTSPPSNWAAPRSPRRPPWPRTTWHQVTWRYDGGKNAATILVNGDPVATKTNVAAFDYAGMTDTEFYIGRSSSGTVSFSGVVDEFSVYPFPLSDAVINSAKKDRVFYLPTDTPLTFGVTSRDGSRYGNLLDCPVNASDTAFNSCPSFARTANFNAYGFNPDSGKMNRIHVASRANLNLATAFNQFTIATWVRAFAATGYAQYVLGGDNGSASSYPTLRVERIDTGTTDPLESQVDLHLTLKIPNDSGGACSFSLQTPANPNVDWDHVAVVFDGNYVTPYVNNQPISGGTYRSGTSCGAMTLSSGDEFYIGGPLGQH